MVVIARFPRLQGPSPDERAEAPAARAHEAVIVPARRVGDPRGESSPRESGRRARRDGMRFPVGSTIVLGVTAAIVWALVWHDERRHVEDDSLPRAEAEASQQAEAMHEAEAVGKAVAMDPGADTRPMR